MEIETDKSIEPFDVNSKAVFHGSIENVTMGKDHGQMWMLTASQSSIMDHYHRYNYCITATNKERHRQKSLDKIW